MLHILFLIISSLIIGPILGALYLAITCSDNPFCGMGFVITAPIGTVISFVILFIFSKILARRFPQNVSKKTEKIQILVALSIIIALIIIVEPIRELFMTAIGFFIPDMSYFFLSLFGY